MTEASLPNAMSASSSSSKPMNELSNFISWLPHEVLHQVFAHLDAPLDLYHTSLVCRSWRSAAVDPRLWRPHYMRFYRASCCAQDDDLSRWQVQKRHTMMRLWIKQSSLAGSQASLPRFLDYAPKGETPDFHSRFVTRMNSDQQLLASLSRLVELKTGILDEMLKIVHVYGDDARDVLAALAADQEINKDNLRLFVRSAAGHEELRLRALDLHTRTAAGGSRPLSAHCLSLRHVARYLLGHLQRREAVRVLKQLHDRWDRQGGQTKTLRERVLQSCIGVEEGLEAVALFRHGEVMEVRQYLDLVALYVWAHLQEGEAADGAGPQTSCNRHLMAGVEAALRSLGFGLATHERNIFDVNNSFIHTALWSPNQRRTTSLTLTAITCAIARRLGVVASPASSSTLGMAVALEDGPQAKDWPGDNAERKWQRFFVIPGSSQESAVLEVGDVERLLNHQGREEAKAEALKACVESATPRDILLRVAEEMLAAVNEVHRRAPDPHVLNALVNGEVSGAQATQGSSETGLAALQAYLTGRQTLPPWPLSPALAPSTLSLVPSTKHGAPRASHALSVQDALYACAWIFRILDPERFGGVLIADKCIATSLLEEGGARIAAGGAYQCDLTLLIELAGGNVAEEMELARAAACRRACAEQEESDSGEEEGSGSESPRQLTLLRRLAADLMSSDQRPSKGLGGAGAGQLNLRDWNSWVELELLDPSHPRNKLLAYRVGSLVKHRAEGYYAVVVGWDTVRRSSEGIAEWFLSSVRGGPDKQPWYHVIVGHDESHRYVSQNDLELVRFFGSFYKHNGGSGIVLREVTAILQLRTVGRCFQGLSVVQIAESRSEGAKSERVEQGGAAGETEQGTELRLVMSPWMREAWPWG